MCGSLDGFSSATQQIGVGQVIPGFCTMIVHSMKYVAFIAGSTDLSFDVSVGQCTLGSAIEMGVYEFENCQNPVLVSNCNTQMNQNNTWPFTATGLHPGCVYYLAFDNNGPAACPFTINITSGSTGSPPLPPPPPPVGPTKVCPGSEVTYSIPPQPFACDYQWTAPPGATINGMASPVSISHETGTTVTVKWGNAGGPICVRAKNSCEMSPPACLQVVATTT